MGRRRPVYEVARDAGDADDYVRCARSFAAALGWCTICGGDAHGRELCEACADTQRAMQRNQERAHAVRRACVCCEGAGFTVGFSGFESCPGCDGTGIAHGLPLVPTLIATVTHAAASLAEMNARRRRARERGEAA